MFVTMGWWTPKRVADVAARDTRRGWSSRGIALMGETDRVSALGKNARVSGELPEPQIRRFCVNCYPNSGAHLVGLVSPYGTAHLGKNDGFTQCGIDARGDQWWWRS